MKHVLDITDLSVAEIEGLIATAEDIIKDSVKYQDVCKRKKTCYIIFRTEYTYAFELRGCNA